MSKITHTQERLLIPKVPEGMPASYYSRQSIDQSGRSLRGTCMERKACRRAKSGRDLSTKCYPTDWSRNSGKVRPKTKPIFLSIESDASQELQ